LKVTSAAETERLKTREWKTRDQIAWVEIAGPENAGPKFQGWKRQDWKTREVGTSCVWVAKHNIINVHVVRGHVRVMLKRMYGNSEQTMTFKQSYDSRLSTTRHFTAVR